MGEVEEILPTDYRITPCCSNFVYFHALLIISSSNTTWNKTSPPLLQRTYSYASYMVFFPSLQHRETVLLQVSWYREQLHNVI